MKPLQQIRQHKWWCALFIGAWLLCLPIRSWCTEGQPMAGQADNAAFYYKKAIDLANIPPGDQLEIIRNIIEDGWQEDHQDLIALLQDNQAAFAELKKGLAQPRCDFSDGKEYAYLYEKPEPDYMSYRNLAMLFLVEGRRLQKEGRHSQALERYLATLAFATHISQGEDYNGYMISTALIAWAGKPLKRYLNQGDLDAKVSQSIFYTLKETQTQRASFAQAMRSEKLRVMSALEKSLKIIEDKGVHKLKKRDPNLSDAQARQFFRRSYPVDTIQDEYNKLADEYWGYMIKAAGSCDPQDWEIADEKILALQKETGEDKSDKNKFHQTIWALKAAASSFMINFPHPAVKRYFGKKYAKFMFSIALPNFSNMGRKICRYEARINAVMQAAEAKLQ